MEHIKQITLWLTSILLIVGLSACDELVSTLSAGDTPHGIPNVIRVGIVMPLSGKYVTAPDDPATLRYLNGFLMARDEINNGQLATTRLEFVIEDDKSTIEGANAAYEKLIHEDKVVAILAPASSTQVEMAFPVAQAKEIVATAPRSASSAHANGSASFGAAHLPAICISTTDVPTRINVSIPIVSG